MKKPELGSRLGLVRFQVEVYEHTAVVSVEKHEDYKRISPPLDLLTALEAYAKRLIRKPKPAKKTATPP